MSDPVCPQPFVHTRVAVRALVDGQVRNGITLGWSGERVTLIWSEGPGMNHMAVVDAAVVERV